MEKDGEIKIKAICSLGTIFTDRGQKIISLLCEILKKDEDQQCNDKNWIVGKGNEGEINESEIMIIINQNSLCF